MNNRKVFIALSKNKIRSRITRSDYKMPIYTSYGPAPGTQKQFARTMMKTNSSDDSFKANSAWRRCTKILSESVIKFLRQTCKIALLNLIWRSLRTFYDPPSWNTPVHTKTVLWSRKWRKNLFTFSTWASSENENSFWNKNKFSHMFPLFSRCHENHEENLTRIWFSGRGIWRRKILFNEYKNLSKINWLSLPASLFSLRSHSEGLTQLPVIKWLVFWRAGQGHFKWKASELEQISRPTV